MNFSCSLICILVSVSSSGRFSTKRNLISASDNHSNNMWTDLCNSSACLRAPCNFTPLFCAKVFVFLQRSVISVT
uniref:Putative secreted protein n=1 Tax=Panstrongylus lignarius TaxID=156445 RepID=A0A224Y467_9HEMI